MVWLTGKEPMISHIAKVIGYTGRKFKLEAKEQVTISSCDCMWDGGSKASWYAIAFPSFTVENCEPSQAFLGPPVNHTIILEPGKGVVVRHSIFCGKDTGLTIYAHPQGLAPLLPQKSDLSDDMRKVLFYTRSLKSSYNGIPNYRQHSSGLSLEQWEVAKAECIAKGLLNKAGAITSAGRNACPNKL